MATEKRSQLHSNHIKLRARFIEWNTEEENCIYFRCFIQGQKNALSDIAEPQLALTLVFDCDGVKNDLMAHNQSMLQKLLEALSLQIANKTKHILFLREDKVCVSTSRIFSNKFSGNSGNSPHWENVQVEKAGIEILPQKYCSVVYTQQ